MLERALKFDWLRLLEDIGFWMPANVNNTEIDNKPENAQELGIVSMNHSVYYLVDVNL